MVPVDTFDLTATLNDLADDADTTIIVIGQMVDGEMAYRDIAATEVKELPDGRRALVLQAAEAESASATDAGAG